MRLRRPQRFLTALPYRGFSECWNRVHGLVWFAKLPEDIRESMESLSSSLRTSFRAEPLNLEVRNVHLLFTDPIFGPGSSDR